MLRVAHGERRPLEQPIVEHLAFVAEQRGLVAVENVVGLLGAVRRGQRCLDLEGMPERLQHGTHQLVLGLGFVAAWRITREDRGDIGHHRPRIDRQQPPLGTLRQDHIQVIVREKLLVPVGLGDGQWRLERWHRHPFYTRDVEL